MLIFKPKRIIKLRQLEKPHKALVKCGISPSTATKLLGNYNIRLTIDHVEKICVMLNCTPNDLFEWKPKSGAELPENHSLNALKRNDEAENLSEIIKKVPIEKLSELTEFVRNLQQ